MRSLVLPDIAQRIFSLVDEPSSGDQRESVVGLTNRKKIVVMAKNSWPSSKMLKRYHRKELQKNMRYQLGNLAAQVTLNEQRYFERNIKLCEVPKNGLTFVKVKEHLVQLMNTDGYRLMMVQQTLGLLREKIHSSENTDDVIRELHAMIQSFANATPNHRKFISAVIHELDRTLDAKNDFSLHKKLGEVRSDLVQKHGLTFMIQMRNPSPTKQRSSLFNWVVRLVSAWTDKKCSVSALEKHLKEFRALYTKVIDHTASLSTDEKERVAHDARSAQVLLQKNKPVMEQTRARIRGELPALNEKLEKIINAQKIDEESVMLQKSEKKQNKRAVQFLTPPFPPPMVNFGSSCFINGALNQLMLSLNDERVDLLKKFDAETMKNSLRQTAPSSLKKLDEHEMEEMVRLALQMRDVLLEMREVYWSNQVKQVKDIEPLQIKFFKLSAEIGAAATKGNTLLPYTFSMIFDDNHKRQLKKGHNIDSPHYKFNTLRQGDAGEMGRAVNDLLLEHVPGFCKGKSYETKTVSSEFQGTKIKKQYPFAGTPPNIVAIIQEDSKEFKINSEQEEKVMVRWTAGDLRRNGCEVSDGIADDEGLLDSASMQKELLGIAKDTESIQVKLTAEHVFLDTKKQLQTTKVAPTHVVETFFNHGGMRIELPVMNEKGIVQEEKIAFVPRSIICNGGNVRSGHYFTLSFSEDGTIRCHNDTRLTTFSSQEELVTYLKKEHFTPSYIDYVKENKA